jgi:hypothetical protein
LIGRAGNRGHFGNVTIPGYFVKKIRISERAACVDGDTPAWSASRNRNHERTTRTREVSTKAAQIVHPILCPAWQYAQPRMIDTASNVMTYYSPKAPTPLSIAIVRRKTCKKASHNSTALTSRPIARLQRIGGAS